MYKIQEILKVFLITFGQLHIKQSPATRSKWLTELRNCSFSSYERRTNLDIIPAAGLGRERTGMSLFCPGRVGGINCSQKRMGPNVLNMGQHRHLGRAAHNAGLAYIWPANWTALYDIRLTPPGKGFCSYLRPVDRSIFSSQVTPESKARL